MVSFKMDFTVADVSNVQIETSFLRVHVLVLTGAEACSTITFFESNLSAKLAGIIFPSASSKVYSPSTRFSSVL